MRMLFVYNADSGRLNSWLDIGHKLLSPDTYSCNLCSLTHGLLTEREEWRNYRESASDELVFLHRDEFERECGEGCAFNYPVILREQEGGGYETLLSAEEIDGFGELAELIERLQRL